MAQRFSAFSCGLYVIPAPFSELITSGIRLRRQSKRAASQTPVRFVKGSSGVRAAPGCFQGVSRIGFTPLHIAGGSVDRRDVLAGQP